jgi:hypothetical protein
VLRTWASCCRDTGTPVATALPLALPPLAAARTLQQHRVFHSPIRMTSPARFTQIDWGNLGARSQAGLCPSTLSARATGLTRRNDDAPFGALAEAPTPDTEGS